MNVLLEPFSYEYMLNAMWVSAMVGGLCAFLSCYLMLKGWSLIGDALERIMHRLMILISFVARELLRTG